jgi:cytochrome c5
MQKFRKYCVFAMLITCSCTASMLVPTADDETLAKQKWSDASMDQLTQGYHLYVSKCGGCHYLHDPKQYTEEKWKKEMPEMGKRAYLSAQQQDLILRYLLTKRESGNGK